jgi:hypothetical protein
MLCVTATAVLPVRRGSLMPGTISVQLWSSRRGVGAALIDRCWAGAQWDAGVLVLQLLLL